MRYEAPESVEAAVTLLSAEKGLAKLLSGGPRERREAFYRNRWDTWRWRLLFRVFFSRFVITSTRVT